MNVIFELSFSQRERKLGSYKMKCQHPITEDIHITREREREGERVVLDIYEKVKDF